MSETPDYVYSKEGQHILGVDRSNFFYYVNSGQIQIEPESPKRRRRYRYADILKVKEKLDQKRKGTIKTIFDWVSIEDLPNTLRLDFLVFGPDEVLVGDWSLYASWLRKNSRITLGIFNEQKREEILAYITLLPLPEKVILDILRQHRKETDILPEEVETYERKGGYTLLAESVVAHPNHKEKLNTLLKQLLHYWCEQYPTKFIERIYAQAATTKGDILIQKLYFAPREDLAENAYVLNLKRPGASRLIRHFQECLEKKQVT